jgi:hypothetical protein
MHEHSLSWLGLWYHTRYTCDTFRLILHNFQFTMIKGYHINLWTTEEDRSWYFNCLYLLSLDVGLIFFISGFLFLLRFKNCSHDSINPLNNITPLTSIWNICRWWKEIQQYRRTISTNHSTKRRHRHCLMNPYVLFLIRIKHVARSILSSNLPFLIARCYVVNQIKANIKQLSISVC